MARGPVDVTYNGGHDEARRTVSINKSSIKRLLGFCPPEIYGKISDRKTGTLLVEGPASLNGSGRYYFRGTEMPLPYPLRSKDAYEADVVNRDGTTKEDVSSLFKESDEVPEDCFTLRGSRFCYVGQSRNGRLKFGQTNDLNGTHKRHRSDVMEAFDYLAAWELNDDARKSDVATKTENAAKEHFQARLLKPRKEWLQSGTPPSFVIDFFEERLRLVAQPVEFSERMVA